jgi:hypothetical protein
MSHDGGVVEWSPDTCAGPPGPREGARTASGTCGGTSVTRGATTFSRLPATEEEYSGTIGGTVG